MPRLIFFDLEGPLSPQDNAYEVMGLIEDGHKIFEVLSRYDDILALETREGYEAGDTLKLIVPFLLSHGITEAQIRAVSQKAVLASGSKTLMRSLQGKGWTPYIISTSYQQHAHNIGVQLRVPEGNIRCTGLPLDRMRGQFDDAALVRAFEKIVLGLYPPKDDAALKTQLDEFYYDRLPHSALSALMAGITVIGGKRKVDALVELSAQNETELSEVIVVGDSITDARMLKIVRDAGGIAIAFNANEYALPSSTIALASPDINALELVTDAYSSGGVPNAIKSVREHRNEDVPPYWHVIYDADENVFEYVLELHRQVRRLVRGEAAKLG